MSPKESRRDFTPTRIVLIALLSIAPALLFLPCCGCVGAVVWLDMNPGSFNRNPPPTPKDTQEDLMVPKPVSAPPRHKRVNPPQANPGYGRGSGPQPWPSAKD